MLNKSSKLPGTSKEKAQDEAALLRARVADNIRLFRRNRGLTQEKLAKRAKLSGRYLAELERQGGQNITIDTLGHLASALNIDVSDLINGAEPMVQKKTSTVRATIALLENYCTFLESMEGAQPEREPEPDHTSKQKHDLVKKRVRRRE